MANNNQDDEYNDLLKEIQDTIEEQNDAYLELNQFSKDTVANDNLDTTITDLAEKRKEIMRFLEAKYNQNTDLRKTLFESLYENKKELTIQRNEIDFLEKKIKDQSNDRSTYQKQIDNQKYKTNEIKYYNNFLFVLLSVQICIIIILSLSKILGKTYVMYTVGFILLCTLAYTLYTVYYNNYNRDKTDWNKFYFESPDIEKNVCAVPDSDNEDDELKNIEKAILTRIRNERNPECADTNTNTDTDTDTDSEES